MNIRELEEKTETVRRILYDSFVKRLSRKIPVNCVFNKSTTKNNEHRRVCVNKEILSAARKSFFLCEDNDLAGRCKCYKSILHDKEKVDRIFGRWLDNAPNKWSDMRREFKTLMYTQESLKKNWLINLLYRFGIL